jgi:hypothetical protein
MGSVVGKAPGITLNGNWDFSFDGGAGLVGARRVCEKTASTVAAAAKGASALARVDSTVGGAVNTGLAGRVANVANGIAVGFDFASTIEDLYFLGGAIAFAINPAHPKAGEGTLVSSRAAETTRHAVRAVANTGFAFADGVSDANFLASCGAFRSVPSEVQMAQQPVLAASFCLSGAINIWDADVSRRLIGYHKGQLEALFESGEALLDYAVGEFKQLEGKTDAESLAVKRNLIAGLQGWAQLVKIHDVAAHHAAKEVLNKSLSTASQWLAAGAIIAGIIGAVLAIAALTNPVGIAVIASVLCLSLVIELGRIAMNYLFTYNSKINFTDLEKRELFERIQGLPILTEAKAAVAAAMEAVNRRHGVGTHGGGAAAGGSVTPLVVSGSPVVGAAAEQATAGVSAAGAASSLI